MEEEEISPDKTEFLKFCPKCSPERENKGRLLLYNKEDHRVFCPHCGFFIDYPKEVNYKKEYRIVETVEFDPEYNKRMIRKTREETHKRNLEAYEKATAIALRNSNE